MSLALEYLFSGTINTGRCSKLWSFVVALKTLDLLRLMMLEKAFHLVQEFLMGQIDNIDELCSDKVLSNHKATMEYINVAEKLKLQTISSKLLTIISNNLSSIIKEEEVHDNFAQLPFDLIKKILEHPAGSLSWKTKAFNLWFLANKETLSDQEKLGIYEVFTKVVTKKLENDEIYETVVIE